MLQTGLPRRMVFYYMGRASTEGAFWHQDDKGDWLRYKGFLSLVPKIQDCFGENDNPLEFFLAVDIKDGQIIVLPKY